MKINLPSVFLGILLGLFLAWLIGMFSPSSPTTAEPTTKIADATAPVQPVVVAPATAVKTTVTSPVAAPTTPAAPASQSAAAAALQAQMNQAAFDKVRQQSRIKAMTNNLRQLSSASQQYMLDKGVTAASYFDLVGTGTDNYIRNVAPVMGEDYSGFYMTQHDTQTTIIAPDGTTAVFNL